MKNMKAVHGNTGNRNTGNWNAGDGNTGDWNTGDGNTGNRNTGNWNAGDRNAGNRNAGDRNAGNRNTGDWNAGNRNTGHFNTLKPKTISVFNSQCLVSVWNEAEKPRFLYFSNTTWISLNNMSDEEKLNNLSHKTEGGYFKTIGYKEAFKAAYVATSESDRDLLLLLPNFDADIFLEISGIDVREQNKTIEIEAIQKEVDTLNARLDELKSS